MHNGGFMHSPIPSEGANSTFLVTISYFTAPCIGLFFMVSGALLLPVKLSTGQFIRRRLSKLLLPTIIWTLIYIILSYTSENSSDNDLVTTILSIPFSAQGDGVLWFMYTLIGFYLIIPIISPWIKKAAEREIIFYITLFAIFCCYPYLSLFINIDNSDTGILYYISGYGGYFILGYFLNKYGQRIHLFQIFLLFIAAVILPIILRLAHANVDFYTMFWYLSLPVVVMCIFWWRLIQNKATFIDRRSSKTKNWITNLSGMSFGIYLSHIAIMRFMIWKLDFILNINNYIIQTLVVFLLSIILAAVFVYFVCRTPLGKPLVGYKIKKSYN